MKKTRYDLAVSPSLDNQISNISNLLNISKSEVFKRALTLLSHAIKAEHIVFTSNGEDTLVKIK